MQASHGTRRFAPVFRGQGRQRQAHRAIGSDPQLVWAWHGCCAPVAMIGFAREIQQITKSHPPSICCLGGRNVCSVLLPACNFFFFFFSPRAVDWCFFFFFRFALHAVLVFCSVQFSTRNILMHNCVYRIVSPRSSCPFVCLVSGTSVGWNVGISFPSRAAG